MREYETSLQNQPVDVSEEFVRHDSHFFIATRLSGFDSEAASGEILWRGCALKQRVSYHQLTLEFDDYKVWWDTPPEEYEDDQTFPFALSFVSPRTVRLRLAARSREIRDEPSLMFDGEVPTGASWEVEDDGACATYAGPYGSVGVTRDPVRFEFRDAAGKLLTRTWNLADTKAVVNSMPTPLCFVRNPSNLHRQIAATFSLASSERLYGCGESFTGLNKRDQRLVLWAYDAYSAQTPRMGSAPILNDESGLLG